MGWLNVWGSFQLLGAFEDLKYEATRFNLFVSLREGKAWRVNYVGTPLHIGNYSNRLGHRMYVGPFRVVCVHQSEVSWPSYEMLNALF